MSFISFVPEPLDYLGSIIPVKSLNVFTILSPSTIRLSEVAYFSSTARSRQASTSITEPLDISKYRDLSVIDFLEHPSARFWCTDMAARRICCVFENLSSVGKPFVILYHSNAKARDAE